MSLLGYLCLFYDVVSSSEYTVSVPSPSNCLFPSGVPMKIMYEILIYLIHTKTHNDIVFSH
jgi:hypothetical protein